MPIGVPVQVRPWVPFSLFSTLIANIEIKQFNAGVAQLVEQLFCNQKVEGSSPFAGTISTISALVAQLDRASDFGSED